MLSSLSWFVLMLGKPVEDVNFLVSQSQVDAKVLQTFPKTGRESHRFICEGILNIFLLQRISLFCFHKHISFKSRAVLEVTAVWAWLGDGSQRKIDSDTVLCVSRIG